MANRQHVLRGRIILVQEERFRLLTEDGRGLLLTLSARARGLEQSLRRWQQENAEVMVGFEGTPNQVDGLVHSVVPAST